MTRFTTALAAASLAFAPIAAAAQDDEATSGLPAGSGAVIGIIGLLGLVFIIMAISDGDDANDLPQSP